MIYLVFVTTSLTLVQGEESSFASVVLAMFCMVFIFQAENIIKKIFQMQTDDMGSLSSATAFAVGGMMGMMRGSAKLAGGAALATGSSRLANRVSSQPNQSGANTQNASRQNSSNRTTDTTGNNGANEGINPNIPSPSASNDTNNNPQPTPQNQPKSKRVSAAMGTFGKLLDSFQDSRALRTIGGVARWYGKAGLVLSGAALASLSDKPNVGTIVGGGLAGSIFSDAISNRVGGAVSGLQNRVARRRLENRQIDLSNAYDKYINDTSDGKVKTHEQMREEAENLMRLDLNNAPESMSESEKEFARTLQNLRDRYEKMGYDDPEAAVMSFLHFKEQLDPQAQQRHQEYQRRQEEKREQEEQEKRWAEGERRLEEEREQRRWQEEQQNIHNDRAKGRSKWTKNAFSNKSNAEKMAAINANNLQNERINLRLKWAARDPRKPRNKKKIQK